MAGWQLSFKTTLFQPGFTIFIIVMNDIQLQAKLGEKIKSLRLKRKMTQNDLAIECEFGKASMSRIESGQGNPTIRTLFKISRALEVPITEFLRIDRCSWLVMINTFLQPFCHHCHQWFFIKRR